MSFEASEYPLNTLPKGVDHSPFGGLGVATHGLLMTDVSLDNWGRSVLALNEGAKLPPEETFWAVGLERVRRHPSEPEG